MNPDDIRHMLAMLRQCERTTLDTLQATNNCNEGETGHMTYVYSCCANALDSIREAIARIEPKGTL